MEGPNEQGLLGRLKDTLQRLRENETLNRVTRGRPDIAIFGAPIALLAVIVIAVVAVAATGGDGDGRTVVAETPTAEATSTREPSANAGLKTPINVSAGAELTAEDLAARGVGEPGRGEFAGERLIIPSIGVDAPFSVKTVPGSGQMPDPNGPEDVVWYDFSQWPGLGGLPEKGGNVILSGHVDYINYGPAVFWDLSDLNPGDIVTIRMQDGSEVSYAIEFNKYVAGSTSLWDQIVQATADESITLITCTGEFSAGEYNNRQVAWGRRV